VTAKGRKVIPPTTVVPIEVNREAIKADTQRADVQAEADRDLEATARAYTRIGAIKAFRQGEVEMARAWIAQYEEVKGELKKAGRLWVPAADGGGRFVTNIDDFYDAALGVSARRVRQLIQYQDTLGEDAFGDALRIGFSYRDLKSLQGLTEEVQELVKSAIGDGDKDKAREIIARFHSLAAQAEKDAAAAAESEARLEAKQRLLADANARADKAILAPKWKAREGAIARTQAEQEALDKLDQFYTDFDSKRYELQLVVDSLKEDCWTKPVAERVRLALEYFGNTFWDLAEELCLGQEVRKHLRGPEWPADVAARVLNRSVVTAAAQEHKPS
jgi:hypothetical protein